MTGTLVLRVAPARTLLTMYRWRADAVRDDVETLGRRLGAAAPYLGWAADGGEAPHVLAHLQALGDQLDADHDDLAWRIAYVEGLGADGVPTAIPLRPLRLRRATIAELVALLDGDDAVLALEELAIRAIADRDVSRAIARALGADGVESVRDRLHLHMLEEALDWHHHWSVRQFDWEDDAAATIARFDQRFQVYGTLLATFSHHQDGRELLEEVFHLEQPDSATNFLPVALLYGDWADTTLTDLYERVFTSPSDFWGGFGRLSGAMELDESELLFPRLVDPHTVLLEAIGRRPELARRLVLEEDAFRTLMAFGDYGAFAGVDFDRSYEPTRMAGGTRLGDGLAALFAASLTDPGRTEEIYAFLVGGSAIDERGFEVHLPGLLHDIADLGLPRSGPLRRVLADAWNLQWHNVAHLANETRPADQVGGAVLAEIFEDEAARVEVMAGFGAYLEVLYAAAFADGDGAALDRAGVGALRAFQHIDHALDELQPDAHDRSVLRSAFRAGAGYGAKQVLPFLGGPPSWTTVAAGFVVNEVVREVGSAIIPDDISRYPTSRSVLHDLFVAAPEHDGPPLPTDAEVIFANAAMAARPDLGAGVEDGRWLVDGVIVPPAGDDPDALDDFGFWFGRNFSGDSPFQPLITAPTRDIAAWLATEEFLES